MLTDAEKDALRATYPHSNFPSPVERERALIDAGVKHGMERAAGIAHEYGRDGTQARWFGEGISAAIRKEIER